ncbi:aldose 1-epimerase [Paraburkholderia terrae]|jgi:aldose 1-epimerase|uniref:aldose 1-epimerase n=1 Tax=Paraburkholderia terrae TaxID=311230 RepID=UPI001EE2E6B9|nr:aldose 1-epimerase [Paraburkholderia terrae]GJH06726.1 aldose 1-epimerase [Paraburkholderia terrae]
MTVANSAVPSSPQSRARRARLAATVQPVLAGPSTSAVAVGAGSAADVACVTLANSLLRLDVAPSLGGGITRFDFRNEGTLVPVFRRCRHVGAGTDANDLACYSLLPYSNRIGGGQFMLGERAIDVPCNRAGEPLPIHGDGWLANWTIAAVDAENLTLTLDRRDGKPYAYRATQTYALDGSTLVITLEVENTGREAMPFGLGVHPFLVRDADTQLSAAAAGLWLSDEDWLPVRHVPVPPAWQFGVAYPLPRTLVNHAFTGWSGHATVVWPKRRLSLTMSSSTEYYILYTPTSKDFFCFEPVDHPINAMNLPGGAADNGMTMLARGERLTRSFSFAVERTGLRAMAGGRAAKRGS